MRETVLAVERLTIQFCVGVLQGIGAVIIDEKACVCLLYWCGLYAILFRKTALLVKHGAV